MEIVLHRYVRIRAGRFLKAENFVKVLSFIVFMLIYRELEEIA